MLKIRHTTALSYILCCSLLLQGCAPTLPEYAPKKDISIPKTFPSFDTDIATMPKEGMAAPARKVETKEIEKSLITESWKAFYTTPELSGLIDTALGNNQQLRIIQQDIEISKNEIMARRGAYLPQVGVGAGYGLDNVSEFSSQGASDELTGIPEILHNRDIGLFATWEVDIWGRLRNAAKSAYYSYLASKEGKRFMVTRLTADIATTYYELLALDQQLVIVKRYINTLQRARDMVTLQQEAARATSLGVNRFQAELLKNESRQYILERKIIVTENNLNRLIGRFPTPIARDTLQFTSLSLGNAIHSLPAELLDNRPDVKRAALDLKAAKLDVKVAKARFYPALSIDAGAGFSSFNSEHFLKSPDSVFYNAAANLTAPLLNRLAIKADYFSANSSQIRALYRYELTLIKAYADVVNQLASITNLEKVYVLKARQVEALNASIDISDILFRAARIDYIDVLFTQRDSLKAQMELVDIKKQQLVAQVNLYRALGGGWREVQEQPKDKTQSVSKKQVPDNIKPVAKPDLQ